MIQDDPAERAVIGACLLSDIAIEDTANLVDPADFHNFKHQAIYTAILATYATGHRVDVLTVHRALHGADIPLEYLHELQNDVPSISNADRHALAVAAAKVRRDLVHAAAAINDLATGATSTPDAAEAADKARAILADIDMPAGRGAPDPDVDTFVGSVDTEYDWLIPDFLERRDRMLVTAAEGMGKSTLLTQIGIQTAAGIHPWTLQPITPRNVLIVDLENSPRLVTRRLNRMRAQAGTGFDPQRLRIHTRAHGLDLTTRTDRRWLIDRCQANAAELLIIGPAYRMSAGVSVKGDIGGEDQARTVTKALDDIRERCGVTLLMETHAPHGNAYGRDLRPFGSSVWLRWPEFGIGLARDRDEGTGNRYELAHWRGPRDERTWPKALTRNAGRWPWTPEGMPNGTYTRSTA
jgi:replicative DNA helicase